MGTEKRHCLLGTKQIRQGKANWRPSQHVNDKEGNQKRPGKKKKKGRLGEGVLTQSTRKVHKKPQNTRWEEKDECQTGEKILKHREKTGTARQKRS